MIKVIKYIALVLVTIVIFIVGSFMFDIFTKQTIEFEHIILETTTSAAGKSVYEIKKQDNDVFVEYSYQYETYVNGEDKIDKTTYHTDLLDLTVCETINDTLSNAKVLSWDNWHKTNSHVLDGGGFTFELTTTDGKTINCSGSNASPKNYGDVAKLIEDLCSKKLLDKVHFEKESYQFDLPEQWLNNVWVRYSDGLVSFYIKTKDCDCSIFNVYENNYGYYDGDKYIHLKEEINNDKKYYLFCAKGDSINSYKNQMNKVELSIVDNLDSDIEKIISSLK